MMYLCSDYNDMFQERAIMAGSPELAALKYAEYFFRANETAQVVVVSVRKKDMRKPIGKWKITRNWEVTKV